MDNKTVAKIARDVARSFPGVAWDQPRIQRNHSPQAKSSPANATYLLVFSGTAHQPNGRAMARHVRVVVDGQGQVLKMSTSR